MNAAMVRAFEDTGRGGGVEVCGRERDRFGGDQVIGPLLQPTLNTSSAIILNAETFNNASYGFINVKDVGIAHVLAFQNSSAAGRYLMTHTVVHLVNTLRQFYPNLPLPQK